MVVLGGGGVLMSEVTLDGWGAFKFNARHDQSAPGGIDAALSGRTFFFITLGLELSDTKVYEP